MPVFRVTCVCKSLRLLSPANLLHKRTRDDDEEMRAEPAMQVVKADKSCMEFSDLACDEC
jgi:hypothetical protein